MFNSKQYIQHLATELINNFAYSSNATTPVLIGSAREKEVIRKLELLLPNGVGIGSGCVIDSYGNTSKQIDIIIYEKNMCPIFCINESPETTYYACEGVIAVGEVKSALNKKELKDIFEKSSSVKQLTRHSVKEKTGFGNEAYPYRKYNSTTSIIGAIDENFDQKNKIHDQIFFFAICGKLETGITALLKNINSCLIDFPKNLEMNLISILDTGSIIFINEEENNITHEARSADVIFCHNIPDESFPFLLQTLYQAIHSGRSVPIKAFNRYLNNSPINTKNGEKFYITN